MTLRALLHNTEQGRICEIREIGEEFEVHTDFQWVDVPDGTTTHDLYNEDGTITKFDITKLPGFAETAYQVARGIAYTPVGNQMDMLFKELQATGTISNSGPWATHIASVKAAIPKDDPQAVYEWNLRHWESIQAGMQGNI
jgi:hypothetical protein